MHPLSAYTLVCYERIGLVAANFASLFVIRHLTQIIYKKFQFLFLSHFVENARRSFGYGCTFRIVREKNIPGILLIHN